MKIPCPSCPDGNEWNRDGPTGRACRTCGGKAYIERHDDGIADDVPPEPLGDEPAVGDED